MTKGSRNNNQQHDDNKKKTQKDTQKEQQQQCIRKNEFVKPLLMRSYHLPNYLYVQDLYQYLMNNHPVLGICFHHEYHPVTYKIRIVTLLGSILFGLAITNIIYLCFVFTNTSYDTTYVAVPATNVTSGYMLASLIEQSAPSTLSITNGNIALWTIGSTLHAAYDNMIWKLAACTCCMSSTLTITERSKRYQSTGTFLVLFSVLVVVAVSTFAVTLRRALDNDNNNPNDSPNAGLNVTAVDTIKNVKVYKSSTPGGEDTLFAQVDSREDLEFLIAYCIELALNYFIYYPIVGTIIFSGVLGCNGKYELCGGRPYEIRQLIEAEKERNKKEEGFEVELLHNEEIHPVVVTNKKNQKNLPTTTKTTVVGTTTPKSVTTNTTTVTQLPPSKYSNEV